MDDGRVRASVNAFGQSRECVGTPWAASSSPGGEFVVDERGSAWTGVYVA